MNELGIKLLSEESRLYRKIADNAVGAVNIIKEGRLRYGEYYECANACEVCKDLGVRMSRDDNTILDECPFCGSGYVGIVFNNRRHGCSVGNYECGSQVNGCAVSDEYIVITSWVISDVCRYNVLRATDEDTI